MLIIGDSVSIGYTTLSSNNVVKQLADVAQVQHGPWDVSDGGAKDTAYGVLCLDTWLMTTERHPVDWDVITFNFGTYVMKSKKRNVKEEKFLDRYCDVRKFFLEVDC